jgi:dihydroflavonol-4-reductase
VVGRPVVRHLVEQGHQVLALARSSASADAIAGLGARPVAGDVLDPAALLTLVAGADRVFHVAGVNELCSLDPTRMDLVNIEGTRNVVAACRLAGVGRLTHTSSAVTIGERSGTVGTETSPHRGSYLSRYERSKHLAEQVALEDTGDLDVVVVNPASVQGPGRSSGTGRLIVDVLNGSFPVLVETNVSIVDIDDCARGHLLAAEKGVPGQRYLLSGASFGMGEVLDLLAASAGLVSRPRFVPGWMASAGAVVLSVGARVTGRPPRVCREMIRVLRAGHVYDGSRATRELGLDYTPLEATIRRTVVWFEEQGLLT